MFIFKGKKTEENTASVAHMGSENTFYYCPERKRWIDKTAGDDDLDNQGGLKSPPRLSDLQQEMPLPMNPETEDPMTAPIAFGYGKARKAPTKPQAFTNPFGGIGQTPVQASGDSGGYKSQFDFSHQFEDEVEVDEEEEDLPCPQPAMSADKEDERDPEGQVEDLPAVSKSDPPAFDAFFEDSDIKPPEEDEEDSEPLPSVPEELEEEYEEELEEELEAPVPPELDEEDSDSFFREPEARSEAVESEASVVEASQEEPEEVPEAEEVSEEVPEEVSEEVSQEVSEEVSQEVSEEVSQEVSEEVSQEVSDEVSQEVSEGVPEVPEEAPPIEPLPDIEPEAELPACVSDFFSDEDPPEETVEPTHSPVIENLPDPSERHSSDDFNIIASDLSTPLPEESRVEQPEETQTQVAEPVAQSLEKNPGDLLFGQLEAAVQAKKIPEILRVLRILAPKVLVCAATRYTYLFENLVVSSDAQISDLCVRILADIHLSSPYELRLDPLTGMNLLLSKLGPQTPTDLRTACYTLLVGLMSAPSRPAQLRASIFEGMHEFVREHTDAVGPPELIVLYTMVCLLELPEKTYFSEKFEVRVDSPWVDLIKQRLRVM